MLYKNIYMCANLNKPMPHTCIGRDETEWNGEDGKDGEVVGRRKGKGRGQS